MNIKVCEDCLFIGVNYEHKRFCKKKGYLIDLMDYCPLGITMQDIEHIEALCEHDRKCGVMYVS